jgi:Xaa-Pro aminopeptidase
MPYKCGAQKKELQGYNKVFVFTSHSTTILLNQKYWKRCRSVTTVKLIIATTSDAEMRYASKSSVTDPFILFDSGKKKFLLLSVLEYDRVAQELAKDRTREVVRLEQYLQAKQKGSALANAAAAFLHEKKCTRVEMAPTAYARCVDTLRRRGIKVSFSKGNLYPERAVKSEKEVQEILKVRNATVTAMKFCISIIQDAEVNERGELLLNEKKLTSEVLKRIARKLLLDYSCEAPDIIISHGKQTALPHHQGSGILKIGEPILLDFFPRSMESGYWFDMTRTVVKGAPSDEIARRYRAVKAAMDAALEKVKPGVEARKVHEAAVAVFEERGYTTTEEKGFLHAVGHGLGLEIHEAPGMGPKSTTKLRKGMVITIEPGLYEKRFGGIRLENTILVTTTGYKDLTRLKRVLT